MSDADYRLKVALDAVNEIDESKIRKEMESIGKKGGKAMSDGLDQESKKGADKVIKNMEGIEKKGNIFTKLGHKIKTAFTGASNAIRGLVASIPVIGQILAVLGLVVTALKGVGDKISHSMDVAREFEDAFAGIRKTVDESETNLRKLEKAVVALSTEIPMTVQELSKIAELGGQLGVPADKLIDFTKTVAMLGVTTNLTSEDAATAFAKIANNTKEPLENIDRMGASVVALGNNFATTESDIVAFANNIASRGAIVGMSTDQIFAIATAFSSVGMEAEAGGTAVSKVISRLSEAVLTGGGSLEAFARVSGSSAQEFAELWSNDPGEAFSNFVAGLGTAGTDAMIILKELELTDERLQKAFLSLANNSDLLTNAIDLSSEARKNNSALQDEANKRFETSSSQLKIQQNRWDALSARIGHFFNKVRVPISTFFVKHTVNVFNFLLDNVGVVFHNITVFAKNLANNMGQAFSNIPAAMTAAVNGAIGSVEGLANKALGAVQWMVDQIKKIPGASSLLGDFTIGTVKLHKISGPQMNWTPLTAGMKELVSLGQAASKDFKIASAKVKQGIYDDIKKEAGMLQDVKNAMDKKGGKRGGGRRARKQAKDRLKVLKDELKKQRDMKIKAVQQSKLDEYTKNKELLKIKKRYDGEMRKLNGKTEDEMLKNAEKYMKERERQYKKDLKTHEKALDKHKKSITKYLEKIDKIKEKYEEMRKDAVKNIKAISHELQELDASNATSLSEKYLTLQKTLQATDIENDGLKKFSETLDRKKLQSLYDQGYREYAGYDLDKLIEYKKQREELAFLEAKTTKTDREKAKALSELTDAEREYNDYLEKRMALEEKRSLYDAIARGKKVGQAKIFYNATTDTYSYENEKGQIKKVTDYKNQELAQQLYDKQAKLQTELEQVRQHVQSEYGEYKKTHSKLQSLYRQDTDNYIIELRRKEQAYRAFSRSIRAMEARAGGTLVPRRAYGGTLSVGMPTMVGENGLEHIIARQASYVQPANSINTTTTNNTNALTINGVNVGNFGSVDDMLDMLRNRLTRHF